VKVHYGEGVAIHIGPKPCVGTREGVGEASAGEHIGQPIERVLQQHAEGEFEMNNSPRGQAARKMRVGPSGSAFRSRFQTSPSGSVQKTLS
jgi:hypothetical protein